MGAGSRGSFKSPILENFFHGDSMENQTTTENRKHKQMDKHSPSQERFERRYVTTS
ncbi:MAG: hypothetical protein SOZ84_10275 [Treponema sp.]|nr:hypothetical protein [Treponema sp.]